MKVEKYPINKYYDDVDIKYVVVHVDLGTEQGTKNHLKNIASASYHDYVPKREGVVIEFVPKTKGAWHAGKVSKPSGKGVALSKFGNPNRNSYGICLESLPVDRNGIHTTDWGRVTDGEMPTDSQIKRATGRIRALGLQYLPIVAHVDLTSYKPKIVREVVKRIHEELRGTPSCLDNYTGMELIIAGFKKL